MRKVVFGLSVLALLSVVFACNKAVSKYPGYEEIEKEMFVKYHIKEESGKKVEFGDIVSMSMIYSIDGDSVLMDTRTSNIPVKLRADSGKYEGDIMGAFLGMNVGDSASIIVNADTFFIKTAGSPESPYFIDSASMLHFEVKIIESITEAEMQAQESAKTAEAASAEMAILQDYLAANNITAEPTESGLIFISKVKGNGKKAESGKQVKVNYEGKLLNGTYFDTSVEEVAKANDLYNPQRGYEPFEFALGQGQVIKGWDEGIAMLSEGGKATLIIPSSIGYGANPRPGGVIKPFNTLVFEVELVEVID
jgi:FKBP-type peptidyl-prolyl cis-trans isomerase